MNFILRCNLMYIPTSLFFLFFLYTFKGSTPSGIGDHSRFWRPCLGPLVYMPSISFVFINIWFSILSTLSVLDWGYSRNVSCALNLISTFYFIKSYMKILFIVSLCIVLFICILQFNLWVQILLNLTMWKVEWPISSYRLKLCSTIRKCTTVFVPLDI